jgi:cytochrome P450
MTVFQHALIISFFCLLTRLWPSIPLAGWKRNHNGRDLHIEGYVIPKGAECVFPAIATQRGPSVPGGDPKQFIPERWLNSDEDYKTLKSLLGLFSLGRRICVGQPLAVAELRTAVAYIVQRFDIKFTGTIGHDFFVTLKPVNALANITPRP